MSLPVITAADPKTIPALLKPLGNNSSPAPLTPSEGPLAPPMPKNITLGGIEKAKSRLEILQSRLAELQNNPPREGPSFILQAHKTLEEFFQNQLTKAMRGELTEDDDGVIVQCKNLSELAQEITRGAYELEAELNKMAKNNDADAIEQQIRLWNLVAQKEVEIERAFATLGQSQEQHRAKLTFKAEKLQLQREAQEFRHKVEILRLQAEENRKENEFLLVLQRDKALEIPVTTASSAPTLQIPTTTFLHRLARLGDVPMLRLCLQNQPKADHCDREGNTPFACAVATGQLEAAQLLLNKQQIKTFKNQRGETLLHLAAQSRNVEMVRWIHSLNASALEVRDQHNKTPIFHAVSANHLECVRCLHDFKARLDVRDEQAHTLLIHALGHEDQEITRWLIDAVPILLTKNDSCEGGPVALAVKKGDLPLAKEMVAKGGKLEPLKRTTPQLLHEAAKQGQYLLIEWLVSMGFGVDGEDKEGCTPLLHAVIEGHLEAVKCLIHLGACTTTTLPGKVKAGQIAIKACSLLHAAIFSKNPIEILEHFQSSEALSVKNELGLTPLESAVRHGILAAARYLLEIENNSANLDPLLPLAIQSGSLPMVEWAYSLIPREAKHIATELKTAIARDHLAIAHWLQQESGVVIDFSFLFAWAETGSSVDILEWLLTFPEMEVDHLTPRAKDAQTPFQAACIHQNLPAAILLAGKGANPRLVHTNGNTAWHLILEKQAPSLAWVRWLHSLGQIEIEAKNNDGLTPLQVAVLKGYEQTALRLEMEARANTQVIDEQGRTLIHLAVESMRRENVIYIVSRCRDLLDQPMKSRETPHHLAVKKEYFELAFTLFEQGAKITTEPLPILTRYLISAIANNVPRVVDAILGPLLPLNVSFPPSTNPSLYAVTFQPPGFKPSASFLAITCGQLQLAESLIQREVKIESGGTRPIFDLVCATIMKSENLVTLKWIFTTFNVRISSETDPLNPFFRVSPLVLAVRRGQIKTANFLVFNGAKIDTEVLLESAVASGSVDMLDWVYERGDKNKLNFDSFINQNKIEFFGWCRQKNIPLSANSLSLWVDLDRGEETLDCMIELGFQINAKGFTDKTPLYIALARCKQQSAQLLLNKGAKLDFTLIEKRDLLQSMCHSTACTSQYIEWLRTLTDWPTLNESQPIQTEPKSSKQQPENNTDDIVVFAIREASKSKRDKFNDIQIVD